MRFVMYGAGAVGGVVGARLHQHGHEVVFIARGAHYEAIRASGLRVGSPGGLVTIPVEVVDGPEKVDFRADDIVVLGMKSQDTNVALVALAAVAPSSTSVVCMQNGVANELAALRYFAPVYGVCIVCPAAHLEPGLVEAYATGTTGLFDIGRFPNGNDVLAERIAAALDSSTCESVARPDIMRWKYRKLVNNLSNAIDALCGPGDRYGELSARARDEGIRCLMAAGIEFVSEEEDRERRGQMLQWGSAASRSRPGASMWQSLARGVSIEADYLNGEIVLLGRLHGVPTPVNAALLDLVKRAAREGIAPGILSVDEVIRLVSAGEQRFVRTGTATEEGELMDSIVMINKVLGETNRIVGGIEPSQLDNPTPCDGWSVRDVLNHITGGADMFAIAAREGKVPDEKLGQLMTGDNLGDDYKGAFKAASARATKAFEPEGIVDKMITLPFGEMPAGAALNIAIFDVATHTWDLAKGTGQSTALDPEVLGAALELAQQMLSDDWRAAGMFGTQVAVPDDAPIQDRLAGFTGRTP